MMNSKAFIAMSGGVDSSVAAALMLEQGYDCTGITLKLFAPDSPCLSAQASAQASARAVEDAQAIASRLGIRHYVLDCTEEFEKKVIHRFAEMYEQGITPNPCVICNPNIKFNLELLFAGQSSISRIATGHYARIERDTAGNRFLLRKAVDFKKDQSYVLYGLSQKQLECACFPLGGLTKQQVREYAKERKFFNEKKPESQDICFVTDGDYAGFIEKYTG
ncbi:MAG: tRNA-specific 2-thiouridylase, partial [Treponema sp.]|nr:tRNA-specific 2-thiouridylase [Treponema sp.]